MQTRRPSNLNQLKNYTGLNRITAKFDWSSRRDAFTFADPVLPGLIWPTQLKLGNASNQRTVEYCLESNDRICNFVSRYIEDMNEHGKFYATTKAFRSGRNFSFTRPNKTKRAAVRNNNQKKKKKRQKNDHSLTRYFACFFVPCNKWTNAEITFKELYRHVGKKKFTRVYVEILLAVCFIKYQFRTYKHYS